MTLWRRNNVKTAVRCALFVMCALLISCGKHSKFEKEARQKAAEAVEVLLEVDRTDTLALQRAILDAETIAAGYAQIDDSLAVLAFQDEFRKILSEKDTILANEIFRDK